MALDVVILTRGSLIPEIGVVWLDVNPVTDPGGLHVAVHE